MYSLPSQQPLSPESLQEHSTSATVISIFSTIAKSSNADHYQCKHSTFYNIRPYSYARYAFAASKIFCFKCVGNFNYTSWMNTPILSNFQKALKPCRRTFTANVFYSNLNRLYYLYAIRVPQKKMSTYPHRTFNLLITTFQIASGSPRHRWNILKPIPKWVHPSEASF